MNSKYWIVLAISLGAIFLTVYSTGKTAAPFLGSRNELLLRKIGHELLAGCGDDTSRVMPIKEMAPNEYRIIFENQLSLHPDSIIKITGKVLSQSSLPANYSLNVVDCKTTENVYGFMVTALAENSLVPCRGRALPTGCYFIDIKFSPAASNSTGFLYVVIGCTLAAILLAGIGYKSFRAKPAAAKNNLLRIGKYSFDAKQHFLLLDDKKITLTNKESKLLLLFAAAVNSLIDRNTLQKEGWENEGVIVTRSLDMFVSRLRKKLQDDPAVKIVNFPGKGYMLEVTA